jgi:uncharacterized membrane protein YvbJ
MSLENTSLSNNCRECNAPVDKKQSTCSECGAKYPSANNEDYRRLKDIELNENIRAAQRRGALILRPILAIIFIVIVYFLIK